MEETHTAGCRSREVGCRGLPRNEQRTGHGGEEEEHRAALGSVGVTVGNHGGDALSKSQHGSKVQIFEPRETIKVWLVIIEVRHNITHIHNNVMWC